MYWTGDILARSILEYLLFGGFFLRSFSAELLMTFDANIVS